jgi:tetratricopeptide (TPR) repeat protein
MDYLLRTSRSPQDSLEKAFQLVQKAVALDDGHGATHGMLGILYADKRDYGKALAEGERAIALDPSGAENHVYYGSILTSAGRPQEAIPIFQKAIRLNPSGPAWYYFQFGQALRMTGRFEEAVSACRKALEISPDAIWANFGLALTYFYAGRAEEAIPFSQKTIELSPSGPSYFYSVFGTVLRITGRFEEAVSTYKKALQLAPDDISTRIGLATTYIMTGRQEEARAEGAEILRVDPNFTIERFIKGAPGNQSYKDRVADALRKAGLK